MKPLEDKNLSVKCTVHFERELRALRSSFNMCPCILDQIGIWQCWFLRRGENRSTGEKRIRREPTTRATYDARTGNRNPGHIGGSQVLSPLHHPCSPRFLGTVSVLFDVIEMPQFQWLDFNHWNWKKKVKLQRCYSICSIFFSLAFLHLILNLFV